MEATKAKTTIALDAMGGDGAPDVVVAGAVASIKELPIDILLFGPEDLIQSKLDGYQYDKGRIKVVNSTEVIGIDEVPTTAIRTKRQSSLVLGLNAVKEGAAHAFVSAGSTGALLTGATLIVGRIRGIDRPALATMIPNKKGHTLLIDSGANVDTKPSYMAQFAVMGSAYMQKMRGIANPRVGLVNIGAEKEKGNSQVVEAYSLLEGAPINFVGNAEARDIPSGVVDVAVCDGFIGNILLKYTEGLAMSLFDMIKSALMSSLVSKIGALLIKKSLRGMKKSLDYAEIGGAPFLGLNALVVKAHGSSNAKAIFGAIRQCTMFIEQGAREALEDAMRQIGRAHV